MRRSAPTRSPRCWTCSSQRGWRWPTRANTWPWRSPTTTSETAQRAGSRRLEAEGLVGLVVDEQLGEPAPGDHRLQGLLGVVLAHEVLQLLREAGGAGAVVRALVQHPLDQRRQRHIGGQVFGEEPLAILQVGVGEAAAGGGELDVALG